MKRLYSIYEATPRIHDSILVTELHYKEQNLLERVQRQVMKYNPTLRNLLYEELLKQL